MDEVVTVDCFPDFHNSAFNNSRRPRNPPAVNLVKPSEAPSRQSIHSFQAKTGSLLYIAVNTRPDVAYQVARLCKANLWPSPEAHAAADELILYLYERRYHGLLFDGNNNEGPQFQCASDASFADNVEDRTSTQGYVMKLFGTPVLWKSGKQSTVTTSSTEAELLALAHTAKELYYVRRFF